MSEDIRKKVFELYKPPFSFNCGYIFDSDGAMVADETRSMLAHISHVARIRGWGRIGRMDDAEKIQDMAGEIVAEALTEFWRKHKNDNFVKAVKMVEAEDD
jgi:hypothetical protein